MSKIYHYTFPNLKHHAYVDIVDENGTFIDDLEIWDCEDFPESVWKEIGFCCNVCINKFRKIYEGKKVSENVLRKLGIIETPIQDESIRE